MFALVTLAWTAAAPTARAAQDISLAEGTVLRFADVAEGTAALKNRDDYIRQLSPFDRQVRLGVDRAVSEQEFVDFLAGHVLPWTAEDIAKLTPLVQDLARKIAPWKLPLPPVVLLIKTSGREEGAAAYCRGPAIVLPQNMIQGSTTKLAGILPHELFHVVSNQNPKLREALYATIGFQPTEEIELPQSLREIKITNPDAPLNNYYLRVEHEGRPLELVPVLFSKSRFDPARGGNLFAYLTFKLMAVVEDNGRRQPVLVDGNPVLFDPAAVPGFHEQIGRNTRYIIHPEEVLADNFVFLLNGRIDLPSQKVVERMGEVLQASQKGGG